MQEKKDGTNNREGRAVASPSIPEGKQGFPVDLRKVMRYFPSAVTVVTSILPSGEQFGLTVSAFCSLSLDPPLVLICIRNESTATKLFKESMKYCVNILAEDQRPIAETFSLAGEAGRFDHLDYYSGKTKCAIVRNTIGYIDCQIVRVIKAGDHHIFIGEAVDVSAEKKEPLLYIDRHYVRLEKEKPA